MALFVNGKKINEIMVQGKSIGFGYSNGRLVFQKKKPVVMGTHTWKFSDARLRGVDMQLEVDGSVYILNGDNEAFVSKPVGTVVSWRVLSLNPKFECAEPTSGTATIVETPKTTYFNITQIKAVVTIVPTPSDAAVSIDGIYTNSKIVDIPTTIKYAVSKEGYIGKSDTIEITADTTVNVTLTRQEMVTVNLTYSPAVNANIISNNSSVTVTRTGGASSGATLMASKGTTARITITPTVSGYKSNYIDVTFDINKDVKVTLASTATYRCYVASNPDGQIIYAYVASNAGPGAPVYMSNTNSPVGGHYFAELAVQAASSSAQLVWAQSMNASLATGTYYNLVIKSINDSQMVSTPQGLQKLDITWVRRTANDLTS